MGMAPARAQPLNSQRVNSYEQLHLSSDRTPVIQWGVQVGRAPRIVDAQLLPDTEDRQLLWTVSTEDKDALNVSGPARAADE